MERLQKYLARCGVASRRKAELMIKQGLVQVNKSVVREMGLKINVDHDLVEVNNQKIEPEKKVYFLLNKPCRVVCTVSDPQGRKKAIDFIKKTKVRIYPVGRLDYHSEGLLLLTNDGQLTKRLTHPRFQIPKTYLITVEGTPRPEAIKQLEDGVKLRDGLTSPAIVVKVEQKQKQTLLRITIREGRNRQIRRMCQKVGHPVLTLKREKLGPLELGNLAVGHYRQLTSQEIEALQKACQIK